MREEDKGVVREDDGEERERERRDGEEGKERHNLVNYRVHFNLREERKKGFSIKHTLGL